MRVLGSVVVLAMVLLGVALAQSQTTPPPQPAKAEHKALAPGDIQWGTPPPVFNKGADFAVLYGDPTKPGVYVVRLKLPAGYKVMPHWHPTDENVTVISGAFGVGMGDRFDARVKVLPAGSFFSMPAHMHHFAISKTESVVEVAGMGPFQLTYVNPEDDPSKRRAKR